MRGNIKPNKGLPKQLFTSDIQDISLYEKPALDGSGCLLCTRKPDRNAYTAKNCFNYCLKATTEEQLNWIYTGRYGLYDNLHNIRREIRLKSFSMDIFRLTYLVYKGKFSAGLEIGHIEECCHPDRCVAIKHLYPRKP